MPKTPEDEALDLIRDNGKAFENSHCHWWQWMGHIAMKSKDSGAVKLFPAGTTGAYNAIIRPWFKN